MVFRNPNCYSYKIKFRPFSEEIATIGEEIRLWIHNIYSPLPDIYTLREELPVLNSFRKALQEEREHIILGDFNLHHLIWNNPGRFTYHTGADQLLDVAASKEMEQALPEGSVTWKARGTESAIDLVFLITAAHNALYRCGTREDLQYGSDHIPAVMEIQWTPAAKKEPKKRA